VRLGSKKKDAWGGSNNDVSVGTCSLSRAFSLSLYICNEEWSGVYFCLTRVHKRENLDVWGGSDNNVLGATCSLSRARALSLSIYIEAWSGICYCYAHICYCYAHICYCYAHICYCYAHARKRERMLMYGVAVIIMYWVEPVLFCTNTLCLYICNEVWSGVYYCYVRAQEREC